MKSLFVFCFFGLALLSSCSKGYDEIFVSASNKKKVAEYYEQANKLVESDPKQAEILANKALELAESLSYTKGMGDAHFMLGLANDLQGNYGKAVNHHLQGLRHRETVKDNEGILKSYYNLAIVYQLSDLLIESEQYYQKALDLAIELGRKEDQAKAKRSIGYIAQITKDYNKSQQYYSQSLDLYKQIGSKKYIGYLYNDLAVIQEFKPNPNYHNVLGYYNKSLQINEESLCTEGVGWSNLNIGRMYIKLKQAEEAIPYLEKAETILQKDFVNLASTLTAKAEAYAALKDMEAYKKALTQAELLESKLQGANKKSMLQVYQLAQEIYGETSPAQWKAYKEKEKKLQNELEIIKQNGRNEQFKSQAGVRKAESDFLAIVINSEQRLNAMLKIAISLIVVFLGIIVYQFRNTRRIMRDYRDFIVKRDTALDIFN